MDKIDCSFTYSGPKFFVKNDPCALNLEGDIIGVVAISALAVLFLLCFTKGRPSLVIGDMWGWDEP